MKARVEQTRDDAGQWGWQWIVSDGSREVARSPRIYGTEDQAYASLGRYVATIWSVR